MKKSDQACRALRIAKTEAEVVTIVRDYLSSLDAAEVALLPAEIMAVGFMHAEEVVQSALELVHSRMLESSEKPDAALLNQIELVFATAARRLAVLAKDPA